MTVLEQLAAEKYVLLTTFRKDGRAVPTPVWAARDGDALAVWTVVDSGKVKRIRNSAAVTVAPCDFRGNPRGAPVPARATLDPTTKGRLRGLIARKYGLLGRLTMFASRVRRGESGTTGIRIVLAD